MITRRLVFPGILLLAACGGGGGGGDLTPPPVNPPPPIGGIDRGGVSQGVVTGFGSIFVNGIRFDTATATFTVDDNPGTESDLAVGKVVTVIGSFDADNINGTATEVIYNDLVEGPIGSIDTAASTLVVLGQTVRVDSETVFDDSIVPNSIDGLLVGLVIEVSGFVDADGSIVATHIELTDDTEFELTGIVSSLDSVAATFRINAQLVDYSGAMLEDIPGGQIADGMRVEVEGTSFGAGGELIATKVELEDDDLPADNDDDVEIEGLITRFVSATDFDVAGRPVTTTASTVFENGSAADLATGVKVEVEGMLDLVGVLVADKVSLRRNSTVRIEAPVEMVDGTAGTVTVLGLTIGTTAVTRFEDDSDMQRASFGLDDLATGDWVEIKAFVDSDGDLVATEIERDDAEDEVEVRAPLDSVSRPDLQLLGLTVQTDSNTEFEDRNEMPISADDFFALAGPGTPVQIKGMVVGDGLILASEVELEEQ